MKKAILILSTFLCTTGVYAQAIMGSTTLCAGSTGTVYADSSGGFWTSGMPGTATIDSFSGSITGVTAGIAPITYYYYGGSTATALVTVNPLPAAITGTASVCEGESTTFSCTTSGGSWSSNNMFVSIIDAGTGSAIGITADTTSIIYTITATGCARTKVITVNPLPFPIVGPANICVGVTDSLYEFGSGVWSTGSTGIISLGAAGDVTGLAAGAASVTYTLSTGCATTMALTVNALPDAGTITAAELVCIGGAINCSNDACCGTWSSSDVAVATIGSGTGTVTGVAEGAVVIDYTVTNACGTDVSVAGVQVLSPEDCVKLSTGKLSKDAAKLAVYPNPAANGVFSIDLKTDNNEPMDIVITDIAGAKVKYLAGRTNEKNDVRLDVAAGLYFISATTAGGKYDGKVVVE